MLLQELERHVAAQHGPAVWRMLPWFLPPGASQADLAAADTLASFLAEPSRPQRVQHAMRLQQQYQSLPAPSLGLLRHHQVGLAMQCCALAVPATASKGRQATLLPALSKRLSESGED